MHRKSRVFSYPATPRLSREIPLHRRPRMRIDWLLQLRQPRECFTRRFQRPQNLPPRHRNLLNLSQRQRIISPRIGQIINEPVEPSPTRAPFRLNLGLEPSPARMFKEIGEVIFQVAHCAVSSSATARCTAASSVRPASMYFFTMLTSLSSNTT